MSQGDITFDIKDGALGYNAITDSDIAVVLGVCSTGAFNTLNVFNSADDLIAEHTTGPGVAAGCNYLAEPNVSAIRFCRVNQLRCSAVSETVASPGGTMSTTGSIPLDFYVVAVEITTDGALGTAVFRYSLDDGDTYVTGITIPEDGIYEVPDSGLILTFAGDFLDGETFNFTVGTNATVSAVTKAAAGSTDGLLSLDGSQPLDAYNLIVEIVQGGVIGEASFRLSLDGTSTEDKEELAIPSSGIYEVPNSGMALTFTDEAGSPGFTAGDVFTATTTAPTATLVALQAALQVWLDSTVEASFVHCIGAVSAATGAAVSAMLDEAETLHKYSFALLETVDQTESTVGDYLRAIDDDWSDLLSPRLMVCAGYADIYYPSLKLINRRSIAQAVGPRMASKAVAVDPGRVSDGSLRYVRKLYADSRVNKELNNKGYTTLRTYDLESGFYCREGRMKTTSGSDYKYVMNRRVMDAACSVTYKALLQYINADLLVNRKTGAIADTEASRIEDVLATKLEVKLVRLPVAQVTAVSATIDRLTNFLLNRMMKAKVRIIPKGKVDEIFVDIGMQGVA